MRSGFSAIRCQNSNSPLARHKVRPVATHFQRSRTANGALSLRPLHNAGDADHERLGHRAAGLARRHSPNHPLPQVQRIGSSHPSWPPIKSPQVESDSRRFGNAPRFSESRSRSSDLTLSIGAERVRLVGRNGSGKSTLIRIIAGMAEPAAGTVQRMGAIAVLAQDWPEDLTLARALGVAEGMAVLHRILSGEGSAGDFDAADWTLESRVDAALAEVGLTGTAFDRRIGSPSGGERTRIGVARLLVEASIFFCSPSPPTISICRAVLCSIR